MVSSVTGAGLVIAFYALISRMSDKIFTNKFKQLEERRREIRRISSDPNNFKEENLKKTTKRLSELGKKIDSIKTFPKYLVLGVVFDFFLFLYTSISSWVWLLQSAENRANDIVMEPSILFCFSLSLALFLMVGFLGIFDVGSTMWSEFEKLKEEKEEIKGEIVGARLEAQIVDQILIALDKVDIDFERDIDFKTDGQLLRADFIVPSRKTPKYLIEVLTDPTQDKVYKIAEKYDKFKVQTSVKTILVSNFENQQITLRTAKAYWDYVVDIKQLEDLEKIIKK
jgi:hypothetical protein